jgi:hypothetical protein
MTTCTRPDCNNSIVAKKLCSKHYQRQRVGKALDTADLVCSVCGGPLRADSKRGICRRTEACRKASNRSYVEENYDRIAARQAEWYRENNARLLGKQAAYRVNNPEKIRDTRRRHGYKMEPEQYQALLTQQGSCCRGCGRRDVKLHIDHDHTCCPTIPTCGKCNRGLLCDRCNRCIGFVGDDPRALRNLAAYLEEYAERSQSCS